SVQAQKLLFSYTDHGDLTPFISANFDSTVGHKREAESYRTIAKELNQNAEDILFLSDIPEELGAAGEAGYQSRLVVRPGNAEHHSAERFTAITSFSQLE
ncbi:MAG: acireductone synthase, partial [bacterium]|nr:acireductone synthase [bacterium]